MFVSFHFSVCYPTPIRDASSSSTFTPSHSLSLHFFSRNFLVPSLSYVLSQVFCLEQLLPSEVRLIFNESGACISPRCLLPLCCLVYSIKSLNSVQCYKNCDLNQNNSAGIAGFWHCQTYEIEEDVLSFWEILIELCG
jgi:hypothetical protein